MNAKKAIGAVALFFASAAVPALLLTPKVAESGVRSVSRWGGCAQTGAVSWTCTGVMGTDFLTGSLAGAYFEYLRWSQSSFSGSLSLKKQSYTGTVYADSVSVSYGAGAASEEIWVTASNVKQNASEWDFLSAEFASNANSAITPIGILFVN